MRAAHWLCLALLLLSASLHAQERPATLAILGATDEQLKALASTAKFEMLLVVESTATAAVAGSPPVAGTLRLTPLRDAQGRLHPVQAALAGAAAVAVSQTAELPLAVPSGGAVAVRITANLAATGEYSGDVFLINNERRDAARLLVTRATQDLGVEMLGLDAVRASVFGSSRAQLNMVLAEKAGRDIQLNPVQVIGFARKDEKGTRIQVPAVLRNQQATAVALKPNESLPVRVEFDAIDGAGEYVGKLRIGAAGFEPKDAEFTIVAREPAGIAALAIFIGAGLSMLLRMMTEKLRPRLVETRRTQLLLRELDEALAEPGRPLEESAVLGALRRQALSIQVALDAGTVQGASANLALLEQRRKLALEWAGWRRRVEALQPEILRDRFRPEIERIRDLIVSATADAAALTGGATALTQLTASIDAALREELDKGIGALRQELTVLAERSDNQSALAAAAQIGQLLDEASAAKTANLPVALRSYNQARRSWAAVLLEDFSGILAGSAPLGLTAEQWTQLAGVLKTQVDEARHSIDGDPQAAIHRYQRAWARYAGAVSDGLKTELPSMLASVENDADLAAEKKTQILAQIKAAEDENAAARSATISGRGQEALTRLSNATALALKAQQAAKKQSRSSFRAHVITRQLLGAVPGALNDARAPSPLPPDTLLRITATRLARIDWFSTLVALAVATCLGLQTLWINDTTWGGWQDWVVAVLWGLGLHQFTFAGVSALRDRLQGTTGGAQ